MRWCWLFVVLPAMAVAAVACGGDEREGLAARLPDVVPPVEEVGAGIERLDGLRFALDTAEYRSNDQMADEAPGDLLRWTDSVDELEAAGRLDGYLVSYVGSTTGSVNGEPTEVSVAGVRIAVDLYESDAAAQEALERRPPDASGAATNYPGVGDAAVAWPNASGGCPCEFRMRAGPFVAAISTSYAGPSPPPELDPAQVAVAEVLARRMRGVLGAVSG